MGELETSDPRRILICERERVWSLLLMTIFLFGRPFDSLLAAACPHHLRQAKRLAFIVQSISLPLTEPPGHPLQ
jgi:hypothetical protein